MSDDLSLQAWLRRIQLDWQLGSPQLAELLHVSEETLSQWMSPSAQTQATVPAGMDQALPLIAIYRRLARIIPSAEDQVRWLTSEHPAFGQNRPYDVMRSSPQNLFWVSYWLDSAPVTT